jgi:hypothetical protein
MFGVLGSPVDSKRIGLVLAGVGLASCSAPLPPRFASWEPLCAAIPVPGTRAEALQRLRTSYALWQRWRKAPAPAERETGRPAGSGSFGYSYVRATQLSPVEVHFTLLEVEAERVVLRALLVANPNELRWFPRRANEPRAITSRWIERGATLGTHDEGAPLKTVDQLYADCERLVRDAESLLPRLYFHPDGLLMQCGYPPGKFADRGSASMLSISRFSVKSELLHDDAAAWLCETELGPVPPGTVLPFLPPDYACFAAVYPTPRAPPPVSPPVAPEACEDPLDCPPPEAASVGNICAIDPEACPPPEAGFGVAHWTRVYPSFCTAWPDHSPRALEVGKSDPLHEWTFPFGSSYGVECSGGVGLRRIRVEAPAEGAGGDSPRR